MPAALTDVLFDRAARDPDRPAILMPELTLSYGQLATEAAGIARLLVELRLEGTRISLLLPNVPRFASVLYGVLGAGGTAVMTNPVNSPREVAEQFADAGVSAAFTTDALRHLLPAQTHALIIDSLPTAVRSVTDHEERVLPLPAADTLPLQPLDGDAPAAILFTAAEEGRARGAVLSHRNLLANLRSTVEMMRLSEEDRMLAALPQVHAFGLTVGLNAALAAGATVVPVQRFHPLRTLELMQQTGVTVFAGVPAMYVGILSVLGRSPAPPHPLRITLSGGAPIHPEVQARWEEKLGIPLRQGYGLTEASPVCLFNSPDQPNRPGTLGRPVAGVEVVILDLNGAPLPPGEVGEICVRGENVFAGYLDGSSRKHPPSRGGWLRTGDLGREEADGFIRFVGLLKAMFTRSGFNVYPREIERVMEGTERIARASVYAQPDPARENEIVLQVEAASGVNLTEEAVREICRSQLAAYKQPGRILIR